MTVVGNTVFPSKQGKCLAKSLCNFSSEKLLGKDK